MLSLDFIEQSTGFEYEGNGCKVLFKRHSYSVDLALKVCMTYVYATLAGRYRDLATSINRAMGFKLVRELYACNSAYIKP